eukprot:EG_transcript_20581
MTGPTGKILLLDNDPCADQAEFETCSDRGHTHTPGSQTNHPYKGMLPLKSEDPTPGRAGTTQIQPCGAHICVATGTGIAPFRSFWRRMFYEEIPTQNINALSGPLEVFSC